MKVAGSLNVSLDFCKCGSRGLVFWCPYIEDILELNVGVSQYLARVALLKGVPHLFGRVLVLDELGNIQRDPETNATHHALIVLVPVFLLLSSLVNITLIGDIPISACDGNRNRGVHSNEDMAAALRHNIDIYRLRLQLPISAVEDKNNVEEYRRHIVLRFLRAMLLVQNISKASLERGSRELPHCSQY
jgi:hypothetical protein